MSQRSKFGLVWVGIGLAAILGVAFTLWSNATRIPDMPREGDMAKFTVEERAPVQLSVTDLTGKPLVLEELYGPLLLVNVWATWCAPCVKELPTLRNLARDHGSDRLKVVTISIDRGGANVVRPFLAENGVEDLPVYLDPKGASMAAFTLRGLPTTLLLAPNGRELGRLDGVAVWCGAAAVALHKHYESLIFRTEAARP